MGMAVRTELEPDAIPSIDDPQFGANHVGGLDCIRTSRVRVRTTDGGTFRGDDTMWDPLTGESRDGRSLRPLPARRLFAFTWQDDHGADACYDT